MPVAIVQLLNIDIVKKIGSQKSWIQLLSNFSKPIAKTVIQLKQLYIIIYRAVIVKQGLLGLIKNQKPSCFSWIKALTSDY